MYVLCAYWTVFFLMHILLNESNATNMPITQVFYMFSGFAFAGGPLAKFQLNKQRTIKRSPISILGQSKYCTES